MEAKDDTGIAVGLISAGECCPKRYTAASPVVSGTVELRPADLRGVVRLTVPPGARVVRRERAEEVVEMVRGMMHGWRRIPAPAMVVDGVALLSVPFSVGVIDDAPFAYFVNLRAIVLPPKVVALRRWAFAYCGALREVKLPASLEEVSVRTFYQCRALAVLKMSEGLLKIGKEAFSWSGSLTAVELPASLEEVGEAAFQCCTVLSVLKLSEGLLKIGEGAFACCTSLTAVELPASLREVGEGAFWQFEFEVVLIRHSEEAARSGAA